MMFRAIFGMALIVATGTGVPTASAGEFRGAPQDSFALWSAIPFIRGADYQEYTSTFSQRRDDVRARLVREFNSMMNVIVGFQGASPDLVYAVAQALLKFDQVFEAHRDYAVQGVPEALQSSFLASMDQLYREHRVDFQKLRFVSPASIPVIRADLTRKLRDRAMIERVGADLVAYGVYNSLGGAHVQVNLTLVKLSTGESMSFSATDAISVVMRRLALDVFTYFQSNQYDSWKNPRPQLRWLLPAPGHFNRRVEPQVARATCESQGARLPFADELIAAAASGLFHEGGVTIDGAQRFMVADQTRWPGQHYYYEASTDPRGPVRTAVGTANSLGAYFCVIGPIDPKLQKIGQIFRAIRYFREDPTQALLNDAAECLIYELGSVTAREEAAEWQCVKLQRATPLSPEEYLSQAGFRF